MPLASRALARRRQAAELKRVRSKRVRRAPRTRARSKPLGRNGVPGPGVADASLSPQRWGLFFLKPLLTHRRAAIEAAAIAPSTGSRWPPSGQSSGRELYAPFVKGIGHFFHTTNAVLLSPLGSAGGGSRCFTASTASHASQGDLRFARRPRKGKPPARCSGPRCAPLTRCSLPGARPPSRFACPGPRGAFRAGGSKR